MGFERIEIFRFSFTAKRSKDEFVTENGRQMKIGILETGPLPHELSDIHGSYPAMFERMLGETDPDTSFIAYRVIDNVFPDAPDEADGWIITGSKHGVYEDHDWIPPLISFIRSCAEARVPMAGFCFGHQVMAQALGGKVVKSEKGWGLGVQSYNVIEPQGWMTPDLPVFSAIAVHQDQIIRKPDEATCIATSDFCEFAALAYGEPGQPYAISVQPHPEFSTEFVRDLIEVRRGTAFQESDARAALLTLDDPINNDIWAKWVVTFFRQSISKAEG